MKIRASEVKGATDVLNRLDMAEEKIKYLPNESAEVTWKID